MARDCRQNAKLSCIADVRGVASFHGLLGNPANGPKADILAKMLVMHGHEAPMVTVDQVVKFEREMTGAGIDWQVPAYGRTMHSFTNPEANNPDFGTVYNAAADSRSWATLKNFLAEVLA